MVKVITPFCWDQNFEPKSLSVPVLGLYTREKTLKMCIKSEFKGIFSELATNDQNDKAFFVDIKILTPGVCLPLPGAIYMWKNR